MDESVTRERTGTDGIASPPPVDSGESTSIASVDRVEPGGPNMVGGGRSVITARSALAVGLRWTWRNPRIVAAIYGVTLLWTVLSVLPIWSELGHLLGRRPAGQALSHGLNLEVLSELIMNHASLGRLAVNTALYSLLTYWVLSTLLMAGLVAALARSIQRRSSDARAGVTGESITTGDVAKWAVTTGPFVFLVGLVTGVGLVAGGGLVWVGLSVGGILAGDMGSMAGFSVRVLSVLPGLALMALADSALDYARISGAVTLAVRDSNPNSIGLRNGFRDSTRDSTKDSTKDSSSGTSKGPYRMARWFSRGLRLLWRFFKAGWLVTLRRGASGLWVHLTFVLGAIVVAGVAPAVLGVCNGLVGWVLLALFGQMFVLGRVWLRVAALAAQTEYELDSM